MFKNILTFFFVSIIANSWAQKDPLITRDSINQLKWVDSIMNKMTVDQKIAQLFMVAAYSNKDQAHINEIENIVRKYQIGGLIFFQGTTEGHAKLINQYQAISEVPMLIGVDAEWGLNMRLPEVTRFPYNMPLGAIKNNRLIEEYGRSVGHQLKRLGMHINFAPSVDINTNPANPIIGNRSFGVDKNNVALKAESFLKGMQGEGILASAKHFPGHGDTAQDSHKTLPTVDFDMDRLDSVELYPYKYLIDKGLTGVMVAHLNVPAIESTNGLPTSISKKAITDLLKNKLNFQGLIYTDALNMKGAANFAKPGEIDLAAFLAGNDVLLFSENVGKGHELIKKAFQEKKFDENRLDYSVRKILKAKYWAGLNNYQPINLNGLNKDLSNVQDELLMRKLVANSITAVKNDNELLPITHLESNKIAYVKLGEYQNDTFVSRLKDYATVDVISGKTIDVVLDKLESYQTVIIGFHSNGASAYSSYKISDTELHWIQEIARKHKVILDIFASPYSLLQLKSTENIDAIIVSYQNIPIFQDLSAQMIFGAMDFKGKLPVQINDEFSFGTGMEISQIQRLGYSIPEEVCLDSDKLTRIDSIAKVVVEDEMAPGLQVLVAKDGKVVYRKSFGYYTYDKEQPVTNESIYDLASVTKILAALPMIMKAEEEGKFTLDTKLGEIIPSLKGSNKEDVSVKAVLSHYGKLKPYITFYKETLDPETNKPLDTYYKTQPGGLYNVKVADHMYLRNDYYDQIYKEIAEAPQNRTLSYKYSDLPFHLFKDYLERTYQKPLDVLVDENYYASLGAKTLTYNPLNKFNKSQIVPTEDDQFFRYQLLHGTVHDEGAAMLGGVSGNAGLFGNSNDVAKMMQMYLQNGYYGGKSYLKTETLEKFNHRYFQNKGNRRGLGFDKPQLDEREKATCGCVSMHSFGHSGYTGTYTFVDPETQIVYVFLSNRVYPTRENTKLATNNIRPEVQRLIQEAIIE
ncbi:glycoside hydrolase family 3 N-terminal domain-containing protein [Namhaeicola litoreus]|uniref:beta-N-acetylhexosaminidase n=1 Tax=Namhaeicola litoreus TaxID=1052145 RepID=A0ABW3Y2H7_9FLAO